MSELINNREYRKEVLKDILRELHAGKPAAEVKARFDAVVGDLDPGELSLIEQSLIDEGLAVEEVQRLCDVHATVFKTALEKTPELAAPSGHPIQTFLSENRAIEQLAETEIRPILEELRRAGADQGGQAAAKLVEKLNLLWDVDKHYSRKENLVFPYLEKYGITAPPKVMWGVDDEIRAALKEVKSQAVGYRPENREALVAAAEDMLSRLLEMVFKEEKILLPMAFETLSEDEWHAILQDSDEIGYCLVEPEDGWRPVRERVASGGEPAAEAEKGNIRFSTGVLSPAEIELIFRHLPVDVTFVDSRGVVKYFSPTKDRIFARTRTIIGRKVENCHPPASVHIVEELVRDFISGKKDEESFWLNLGGKYVLIRYFAVRDENGAYAGTLEVTQDIKPLQAVTGEKRIAD